VRLCLSADLLQKPFQNFPTVTSIDDGTCVCSVNCLPEMTSSQSERLFFLNDEKTVPGLETLLLPASTTPLISKSM
jgi:hypothetical protein